MSTTLKRTLFAIVVLILIPPTLFVANLVHIKMRMYHLQHADHTAILAACREAITNRSSYRNDNAQWGFVYKDDVVILPPLPDNLPIAIRELHPSDVIIHDDSVLINLSLPFCRLCLLGFKPGAKQYGTFKYVDGLWFWNGNDSTKNEASQTTVSWSNKSLQATRDGRSSSASRFTLVGPACLSSGR